MRLACLDRLPEEVTLRKEGAEFVLMAVRFANAVEVFSRAREARERRLRLWDMLFVEEWFAVRYGLEVVLAAL